MYALNTYIDNTLVKTEYFRNKDKLDEVYKYYLSWQNDYEQFTIIEVEPWQYPNSPDKAMNEITEECF